MKIASVLDDQNDHVEYRLVIVDLNNMFPVSALRFMSTFTKTPFILEMLHWYKYTSL